MCLKLGVGPHIGVLIGMIIVNEQGFREISGSFMVPPFGSLFSDKPIWDLPKGRSPFFMFPSVGGVEDQDRHGIPFALSIWGYFKTLYTIFGGEHL